MKRLHFFDLHQGITIVAIAISEWKRQPKSICSLFVLDWLLLLVVAAKLMLVVTMIAVAESPTAS